MAPLLTRLLEDQRYTKQDVRALRELVDRLEEEKKGKGGPA